jgi:hypothetical protein
MLGKLQRFSKFVPRFAQRVAPLQELLVAANKGARVSRLWNEARHGACVDGLYADLVKAPELALARPGAVRVLYADGSSEGWGAVLAEGVPGRPGRPESGLRDLRPLGFASGAFDRSASRSAFEQELEATFEAVRHFELDLAPEERLLVLVDHENIIEPPDRLSEKSKRQLFFLQQFNLEFVHVAGKEQEADLLSRSVRNLGRLKKAGPREPLPAAWLGARRGAARDRKADVTLEAELPVLVPRDIADAVRGAAAAPMGLVAAGAAAREAAERDLNPLLAAFRRAQREDPAMQHMWEEAEAGNGREKGRRGDAAGAFVLDQQGLVCRVSYVEELQPGPRGLAVRRHLTAVVPEKLVFQLVRERHERGHGGARAVLRGLAGEYWSPVLAAVVREVCGACTVCAESKAPTGRQRDLRTPAAAHDYGPLGKMTVVNIDTYTGVPANPDADRVLVVRDHFTRYLALQPLKGGGAAEVIKALEVVFGALGFPRIVVADNGPENVAKETRVYLERSGVILRTITPGNARANFGAEAPNKFLKFMLRSWAADERRDKPDWPQYLPRWAMQYNNLLAVDQHSTPHVLMFGRPGRLPGVAAVQPGGGGANPRGDFKELAAIQMIREELSAKVTAKYNAGKKIRVFQVGDWVRLINSDLRPKKTDPVRMAEPYVIAELVSDAVARVTLAVAGAKKAAARTVSTRNLAPYYHHDPARAQKPAELGQVEEEEEVEEEDEAEEEEREPHQVEPDWLDFEVDRVRRDLWPGGGAAVGPGEAPERAAEPEGAMAAVEAELRAAVDEVPQAAAPVAAQAPAPVAARPPAPDGPVRQSARVSVPVERFVSYRPGAGDRWQAADYRPPPQPD